MNSASEERDAYGCHYQIGPMYHSDQVEHGIVGNSELCSDAMSAGKHVLILVVPIKCLLSHAWVLFERPICAECLRLRPRTFRASGHNSRLAIFAIESDADVDRADMCGGWGRWSRWRPYSEVLI